MLVCIYDFAATDMSSSIVHWPAWNFAQIATNNFLFADIEMWRFIFGIHGTQSVGIVFTRSNVQHWTWFSQCFNIQFARTSAFTTHPTPKLLQFPLPFAATITNVLNEVLTTLTKLTLIEFIRSFFCVPLSNSNRVF